MEPWREALGIEHPRWPEIAVHLAKVTQNAIYKEGKNSCDLTNHLREVGNPYIEPVFVNEYISGKSSFGCFFQQYQDFLKITPTDVFPKATLEQAPIYFKKLTRYLGSTGNVEFLSSYLIYKPGEELREHIKRFFTGKKRALEKTSSSRIKRLFGGEVEKKFVNSYVQPDVFKEIIEQGTFSLFKSKDMGVQPLINLLQDLKANTEELTPCRNLTPAEKFELHQRWVWSGGWSAHGPHINGPEEVERLRALRTDPLGRTKLEEIAYGINGYILERLVHDEFLHELTSSDDPMCVVN